MPEPGTLAVFALAALALIVVPGPNILYIIARGLSEGRRAGLTSALGVETGTLLHTLAAAIGLSALLASSSVAFGVVKYAGAAYLIYLGLRALLTDETPSTAQQAPEPVSLARVYRDGVLVQLLNPKVALFFLAFLPQFVDPDGAVGTQILVLGGLLAVLGTSIDCLYALAAGAVGARLRAGSQLMRRQRQFSGVVYLALGAAAALTGPSSRS